MTGWEDGGGGGGGSASDKEAKAHDHAGPGELKVAELG